MKTLFLSLALVLGTFAFANAQQDVKTTQETATVAVVAQQEDGYADVKLDALSEKVQTAIKANYADYTVKSTAFNAEKKLAKVVLVSKADKSEKTVILDEEGKEVTK